VIDWLAFSTYTFVMSITPGPNNIMLLASGARFGLRRSIPHMLGVNFGFVAQTLLVCAAFGMIRGWLPTFIPWLKWAGVAYMVYLAIRLLGAGPVDDDAADVGNPLTAWEAALFQWINPKAWVMATTTASVFLPSSGDITLALAGIGLVLFTINLPSILLWAAGGNALRGWLADDRRRLMFNVILAVLLALTAVSMVRTA
jgi:threonine/homoserine/homoserine lactone efflux protein